MRDLPAPFVPADCDLRSYDWFPFHHKRLRQSSFWKRASDLACRISVDFWSEAYEQVPAGSLPDDDYILAEWAGFGRRNLDGWEAVKDEVMSAWTLCSDGRWYHPTLCEVARRAWSERQMHQWERECDRIRKANVRRAKDGLEPLPLPPKPSQPDSTSDGNAEPSEGRPADVRGIPAENALTETKTKTKEKIDSSPAATGHSKPRKYEYPPDAFATWYARYPRKQARSEAEKAFRRIERADNTPFDALLAGIDGFWKVQPDVKFWPHPASWLNGRRWLDEPTGLATNTSAQSGPRIDFGAGVSWPEPTVRAAVNRWRSDPSTWPSDRIGPPPNSPGCLVPDHLLREAA